MKKIIFILLSLLVVLSSKENFAASVDSEELRKASPITGKMLGARDWTISLAVKEEVSLFPGDSWVDSQRHVVALFEGYAADRSETWLHGISFGEERLKETEETPVFKFWSLDTAKKRIGHGYRIVKTVYVDPENVQHAQNICMLHKRRLIREVYDLPAYISVYFDFMNSESKKDKSVSSRPVKTMRYDYKDSAGNVFHVLELNGGGIDNFRLKVFKGEDPKLFSPDEKEKVTMVEILNEDEFRDLGRPISNSKDLWVDIHRARNFIHYAREDSSIVHDSWVRLREINVEGTMRRIIHGRYLEIPRYKKFPSPDEARDINNCATYSDLMFYLSGAYKSGSDWRFPLLKSPSLASFWERGLGSWFPGRPSDLVRLIKEI